MHGEKIIHISCFWGFGDHVEHGQDRHIFLAFIMCSVSDEIPLSVDNSLLNTSNL